MSGEAEAPPRRRSQVVDPAEIWRSLPAEDRDSLGEAAVVAGLLELLSAEAFDADEPPPGIVFAGDSAALDRAAEVLGDVYRRDPTLRPVPDLHAFAGIRFCHACGCTDEHTCPDGCAWVSETLCSACAEAQPGDAPERQQRGAAGEPKPTTR